MKKNLIYENKSEKSLSLHAMIVFRKALKTIDSKVMADIKENDLTPKQFSVLEIIYSKGSLKIGQLIEKVLSTSGNMTVVIKNMEKKGLVEKINDNMALIHIEKANADIRGLYPYINKMFLVDEFPDVEWVNREEDMGVEGLRKAKLSYYPERFVEKYTVREV